MAAAAVLACMLPAAAAAAAARASLVAVGSGENLRFWIDAETLRRQGPIVHYRLHGLGTGGPWKYATFEAEVGVHCAAMRRVEYVSTTRGPGGVETATAHELQEVVAGSRVAAEAVTACELAGGLPQAPSDGRPRALGDQAGSRRSGTAFAVAPAVLVTNHHVVEGCADIRVVRDGFDQAAQVVAADAASDLAALAVPAAAFQPLELAAAGQDLGEPVAVLGYPLASVLGAQLRVTTGIVSAVGGIGGDRNSVQISAPVNAGNSGGPLLDASGAVAGVVTRKLDARSGVENVGFAVRVEALRGFLRDSGLLAPAPLKRKTSAAGGGLAPAVRRAAASVFMVQCGRAAGS